nr:relaxase domain-containing protein [Actinomycetota bacterium]
MVVSIGKLGSGARSERYYTDAVARGREDYYQGAGEAPGRWLGQGAAGLGLRGEVSADGLSTLMQGRDPASGERLRRTLRDGAVTGFDLTFSAPKSVSILYAAAPDEVSRQAREAHDRAVSEAVAYLEREACATRRGTDGVERLHGEGFVAAAFRHRTSRSGDPQLHTHVVVTNLTRAEARYSTLDGRLLYAHAKTAGYLYQAALRSEITHRLGLEWGPVRNGRADLVAVPREVIEHFSTRRAEVVEELERQGTHTAQAARVAALDTRRGKDYAVPVDRLRADWRSRAEEFGLGRALGARPLARQPERGLDDEEVEEHGQRLAGPHGLTAQESTFDRRDVVRAFAEAHGQGAAIERVEQLAERFLASPLAVRLESPATSRSHPGGPRYSTPELLALERALVEGAERRRSGGAAVADESEVEAAIEARPTLSGEQRAMVRGLCSSGDGVQVVRGRAGTGKT